MAHASLCQRYDSSCDGRGSGLPRSPTGRPGPCSQPWRAVDFGTGMWGYWAARYHVKRESMVPKPKIFLSYRRDDSEQATRNIYHGFMRAGYDRVFMDIPAISSGENWPGRIARDLSEADVVIVVIGDNWLSSRDDDSRRRIDVPDDPVRWEISKALRDRKKIIPVLVGKADMPSARSLPEELRDLASFQAKRLTSGNWDDDVNALVSSIGEDAAKPMATLVLTSTSLARQRLLRTIGWAEGEHYFAVHASVPLDDNDSSRTLDDAKRLAMRMARTKVRWLRLNPNAVYERLPYGWSMAQTILVGVDTIVFCGDKILDRPLLKTLEFAGPQDIACAKERAREMLVEESGARIHVITGLAVAAMGARDEPATTVVVTEAKLRAYQEADVTSYISSSKPFDKAGAFGVQDSGVSLFEWITGSYTNVVGLPLREFVEMLERECRSTFTLPELTSPLAEGALAAAAPDVTLQPLSVVCVGDINYDFVYDKFPPGFLPGLTAPGRKVQGPIRRAVGGTAVNFAKGAKKAGFSQCTVVGVVGGDALGQHILTELAEMQIDTIYHLDPAIRSSIAIILRDEARTDISLTLTDAHQSLPAATVNKALTPIEKSDVVYCSGYCLIDSNRYDSALDILRAARKARCLVVLDMVVGMIKNIQLGKLGRAVGADDGRSLVDVAVAEMPEIFDWLGTPTVGEDEIETWREHSDALVAHLRARFPVTILRTRSYTHEIVITPDRVDGPYPLDYGGLPPVRKTGYGDARTASQVHSFLSPRIVLASRSPQRRELLGQIVATSKIQVVPSTCAEEHRDLESPQERVKRIASEKAESVLASGEFHDDIELIIGADTEIVRLDGEGHWEMIGHPDTVAQALKDLGRLNNGDHYALTGLAVIGKDPQAEPGRLKRFVACEKTTVTFIDADDEQLRGYAETGEPIGRAGAYAIQGLGALLISSVDGSYSNVVGLPLEKLSQVLAEEFGKPIWQFDKVSDWHFPDPIKGLRV